MILHTNHEKCRMYLLDKNSIKNATFYCENLFVMCGNTSFIILIYSVTLYNYFTIINKQTALIPMINRDRTTHY